MAITASELNEPQKIFIEELVVVKCLRMAQTVAEMNKFNWFSELCLIQNGQSESDITEETFNEIEYLQLILLEVEG